MLIHQNAPPGSFEQIQKHSPPFLEPQAVPMRRTICPDCPLFPNHRQRPSVRTRSLWRSTTKDFERMKQQRPTQGNYCWSNSTRMGTADPRSLSLSPERDSRALLLGSSTGSSTCPATRSTPGRTVGTRRVDR